ncbi:MAG: S23 ribosomal protein [Candidatus Berkelbacteria bacterium Licking1014_7]|uniref:S23 ribosomal protein n=1 Tax=Candidatus Berkelbacteria bacterium Licking1014_7 TaxID=2017147 RepID=A0A554LKS5_9BACT|nr:MAG: S23 ribosomal protein [Candidatus Berkelbacteria bacterium Licking1014_7]
MTQFSNTNYNLEERTAKFGEEVIVFCRALKQTIISVPIISQLIRSSTSVGANYMEANAASSKKDFRTKIFICKKEIQESKHWLRMLAKCEPDKKDKITQLWKEAQELTMIFQKITNSLK